MAAVSSNMRVSGHSGILIAGHVSWTTGALYQFIIVTPHQASPQASQI